jgi:hypothetical protein
MKGAKSAARCIMAALLASCVWNLAAETPKLKIRTKHGTAEEEKRKEQMERLAKEYDLAKYTITRDMMIEAGAINHSSPELTLNLRFLDNDDLALSAYVHEQGHWVLMKRNRMENPRLLEDLERSFPNLNYDRPEGDGDLKGSYFHIAVCMLEWQAMEDLVGTERARKVIEWKKADHYKGLYELLMTQRGRVESVLRAHHVAW